MLTKAAEGIATQVATPDVSGVSATVAPSVDTEVDDDVAAQAATPKATDVKTTLGTVVATASADEVDHTARRNLPRSLWPSRTLIQTLVPG